jgi:hypothetical protein
MVAWPNLYKPHESAQVGHQKHDNPEHCFEGVLGVVTADGSQQAMARASDGQGHGDARIF